MVAPWFGLLRAHSADLNRIQRLLDPLAACWLFGLIVEQARQLPVALLLVFAATALILPQGCLYQSYRQASLITLARRLTLSWCLVLTSLLAVAFVLKRSAGFSRLEISLWALLSWAVLFGLHVGGRKLLRWYRIRGGNSRSLLYWGMPDAAVAFHQQLQQAPYLGLRLVAWFTPQPPLAKRLPSGMPACGGNLADLRRWLNAHRVDQIVFSYVSRDDLSMQDLIRFFADTCAGVERFHLQRQALRQSHHTAAPQPVRVVAKAQAPSSIHRVPARSPSSHTPSSPVASVVMLLAARGHCAEQG